MYYYRSIRDGAEKIDADVAGDASVGDVYIQPFSPIRFLAKMNDALFACAAFSFC